jgi:hypothetical protein
MQTLAPAPHRREEVVLDREVNRLATVARRAAAAATVAAEMEMAVATGMPGEAMATPAEIAEEGTEIVAEEMETAVAKAIPASNARAPQARVRGEVAIRSERPHHQLA